MNLVKLLLGKQRMLKEEEISHEIIGGDLEHPINVCICGINYKPYVKKGMLVLLNPNHGSKVYLALNDVKEERVLVQDTGFVVKYNDILLKHMENVAKEPEYKHAYILDPKGSQIDLVSGGLK